MSPTYYTIIDSPLGPLCLTATEQGLTQVDFARAIEISVHTLRNWEQGRRRP